LHCPEGGPGGVRSSRALERVPEWPVWNWPPAAPVGAAAPEAPAGPGLVVQRSAGPWSSTGRRPDAGRRPARIAAPPPLDDPGPAAPPAAAARPGPLVEGHRVSRPEPERRRAAGVAWFGGVPAPATYPARAGAVTTADQPSG
jgi:hypothetical protein